MSTLRTDYSCGGISKYLKTSRCVTYPDVVVLVREAFHRLISAFVVILRVVLQNIVIFVVLRLEEVVQNFFIIPSVVSHLSPAVVVSPVPPYVYHVIDGAGPSHNLHIITV